jgi:pyruvate kinase
MDILKSITQSKIICTIGPATNTPEAIRQLSDIGMDCARINFSHGTSEYKEETFHRLRETDPKLAILCDIQGPKVRIGEVKEGGAVLQPGQKFTITSDEVMGDENKVSIQYKPLPQEFKPGYFIYINDGIVCVKVDGVEGNDIHCTVLAGGYISTRKGVNLPHTEISMTVPTEKDKEDLKLIAKLDPEYVAISFVGYDVDVLTVKNLLAEHGNENIKLISKIERPQAVENFDAILEVSDGIMVARGDLGVELKPEEVLPAQKMMIHKCNIAGKPIIVATQMLESMIKAPVPTRAEVSDVFNAIEDGADAVMLSAETAAGDYPDKAVEIMERIIRMSESLLPHRDPDDYDSDYETIAEIMGHLVYNACKEFDDMKYDKGKVICLTSSGYTAKMISKYRPSRPILGVTTDQRTAREMRLIWGIEPLLIPELATADKTVLRLKQAVEVCLEEKFIDETEKIVIAGNFFDLPSQTNMLAIFPAADVMKIV